MGSSLNPTLNAYMPPGDAIIPRAAHFSPITQSYTDVITLSVKCHRLLLRKWRCWGEKGFFFDLEPNVRRSTSRTEPLQFGTSYIEIKSHVLSSIIPNHTYLGLTIDSTFIWKDYVHRLGKKSNQLANWQCYSHPELRCWLGHSVDSV